MQYLNAMPQAPASHDACGSVWHTLTLNVEGNITNGDGHSAGLLDSPADVLCGKAIATVISGLPFSVKTPGYNLAYAMFHGSRGESTRRTARSGNGKTLLLDTVLASRHIKGEWAIFLGYRQVHPEPLRSSENPQQ